MITDERFSDNTLQLATIKQLLDISKRVKEIESIQEEFAHGKSQNDTQDLPQNLVQLP